MKKIVVLASLLLVVNTAFAQVKDPKERKELKDVFVKECMSTGTSDNDDPAVVTVMKIYCDCSAEKMLDKFTTKDFEAMNSWTEDDMTTKLTPVIQGCLDKLKKDLEVVLPAAK